MQRRRLEVVTVKARLEDARRDHGRQDEHQDEDREDDRVPMRDDAHDRGEALLDGELPVAILIVHVSALRVALVGVFADAAVQRAHHYGSDQTEVEEDRDGRDSVGQAPDEQSRIPG